MPKVSSHPQTLLSIIGHPMPVNGHLLFLQTMEALGVLCRHHSGYITVWGHSEMMVKQWKWRIHPQKEPIWKSLSVQHSTASHSRYMSFCSVTHWSDWSVSSWCGYKISEHNDRKSEITDTFPHTYRYLFQIHYIQISISDTFPVNLFSRKR